MSRYAVLAAAVLGPAPGYVGEVAPELPAHREQRHQRIVERRSGPVIIVHRGAAAFAPENTLEAYAAAMDYGADGCEIDIRRTADGVLVLFHDDMLDRLTDGYGSVDQITYWELLSLQPRSQSGSARRDTRPPTLAALLELARQRAMLLHLDVKEPNLDGEIARLIEAADVWDHVVAVNTANALRLLSHPKLKLLRYKGGLYENRQDVDPKAIKAALARPGQMVIVDDPRVAARELKRPPYQPVLLPRKLRTSWPVSEAKTNHNPAMLVPSLYLKSLANRIDSKSSADLTPLLSVSFPERDLPDGAADYQRRRTERILERAWAAQRLGQLGRKSARLVQLLERQIAERSLHRDWMYHGLDGAMAVRALAALDARESVPSLAEAFRRMDPALSKVANPEYAQNPVSWTDFRVKMEVLPALGRLRSEAGKRFLFEYLALEEKQAREFAPPQFEEAAKALLRHKLTSAELKRLLQSPHAGVRGEAILECLDHPTTTRTAALKEVAPWALELPGARR